MKILRSNPPVPVAMGGWEADMGGPRNDRLVTGVERLALKLPFVKD